MSLAQLDVDALLKNCRDRDNWACHELFRRAIVENDQRAWTAVHEQYQRLVRSWLSRHTTVTDDLVQEAFFKFARSTAPEEFSDRLKNLPLTLDLLRDCARSVAIDLWRREQRREALDQRFSSWQASDLGESLESSIVQRVGREMLRARVAARLQDEEERLVFRLSYVHALSPRQIVARCPERFPDVKAIYRIKERIVKRLSSDEQLRQLWVDS